MSAGTGGTAAVTLEEIRARLREIAPDPDADSPDAAEALARNLTVSALRRNSRLLNSNQPLTPEAVSALCYQFAAVHLVFGDGMELQVEPGYRVLFSHNTDRSEKYRAVVTVLVAPGGAA